MSDRPNSHDFSDPAAAFAAASSLRAACDAAASADPSLNLSEANHGYDQFMREVMRIGTLFEAWACKHVVFEALGECWPYFLEDRFGTACLAVRSPESMNRFDEADCLHVAMELRLPVWLDGELRAVMHERVMRQSTAPTVPPATSVPPGSSPRRPRW
ncbi:MAG TPA: hypothetical protein VIM46_06075 [Luteolibacter sp.]